ncbi:hypothetical protein [Alteraurantiacibacter buctensis]|uniref:Uncharacterized protein n=1 Tax=Alteraurantiacibacter buctensis TaxID=1503981 RepID=A0A844YWB0_9SPHN|nr:hypothetical protein [Alteraurantiacibacter buctensis]MXO72615.1 hypothetical protein [Alteraurantiacibacter buctensis]
MNTSMTGATGADRRAQIEALLASYPDTTDDELRELLHWFKHEATALDVGMVASNPLVTSGYRRFRADQLDRLTLREYALMTCVVGMVAALLAYAVWYFA